MLVRRSLPFEKALRTATVCRMIEGAITTRWNQVIKTNIKNMIDSRVRFKILAQGNFNMGVQQHKVNSSLEYLKGVSFTKISKLVPPASMALIHPVLRKIIYQRDTKCNTWRKAISICKTVEKNYTRPINFVNSEGVSDTIDKSPSSGEASKHN